MARQVFVNYTKDPYVSERASINNIDVVDDAILGDEKTTLKSADRVRRIVSNHGIQTALLVNPVWPQVEYELVTVDSRKAYEKGEHIFVLQYGPNIIVNCDLILRDLENRNLNRVSNSNRILMAFGTGKVAADLPVAQKAVEESLEVLYA